MKLKSAIFYEALKAAYKRLGISASYVATSSFTQLGTTATFSASAIKASFQTGEFLISSEFLDVLNPLDGVGSSDGAVLSVFKTFTDDSSAAEDATLAFFKVLAENGYVSEEHIFSFFKSLTETATVLDPISKNFSPGFTDAYGASEVLTLNLSTVANDNFSTNDQLFIKHPNKRLNEAPSAVDAIEAFAITKLLADQATVTDDLDGEATAEDDQEMQFAKVTGNIAAAIDVLTLAVNYNRVFTDSYGVTDSDVLHFGKRPADTTSMTDVGSLRSQGFADFTYFAEDYVGASRTFT